MKKLFFGLCLSLLIQGGAWAQNCGFLRFTCTPTATYFTPTFTPTFTATPSFTATPTGSWTPILTPTVVATIYVDGYSQPTPNGPKSFFPQLSVGYEGTEELVWPYPSSSNSVAYASMSNLNLYSYSDNNQTELSMGQGNMHIILNGGNQAIDMDQNGLKLNSLPIYAVGALSLNGPITVGATPVPGVSGVDNAGSSFVYGLKTSFAPTPTPGTSGLVTTAQQNLLFVGGAYAGASASPTPTPNILSGFVTLANDLTPVAVANTNFSANTRMVVTAKNSVTGVVNSFGVTCISGACSIVGTAAGAVTGMWIAQP